MIQLFCRVDHHHTYLHASKRDLFRATIVTFAPDLRYSLASEYPMPELPPVIMTCLPSNRLLLPLTYDIRNAREYTRITKTPMADV